MRKSMTKKLTAVVLTAAMALTAAGCGNNSGDNPSSQETLKNSSGTPESSVNTPESTAGTPAGEGNGGVMLPQKLQSRKAFPGGPMTD